MKNSASVIYMFSMLVIGSVQQQALAVDNNTSDLLLDNQSIEQEYTPVNTQKAVINEDNTNTVNDSLSYQEMVDPTTSSTIDNAYTVNVPSLLSLQQAQEYLLKVSPKLAAERAAISATEFQAQAADSIDHPSVFFRASANAYKVREDIDLTDAKDSLANSLNADQAKIFASLGQIFTLQPTAAYAPPLGDTIASKIPDEYAFNKSDQSISAGVGVVWPVYTAGRTEAIEGLLNARTDESKANAQLTEDEIYTTLVERYFNAQLAIIAAYLRADALDTIKQTDYMSSRLYEEGFISLVDRMQAQTALADAQSESTKSDNDAKLAMMALQRMMRTDYRIKPTTPLFVSTKPLSDLSYYQDIAFKNHPSLRLVDAKLEQANQLHNFSDNQFKPMVSMFGYVDIHEKPSWVAGVSATWSLTGGLDKSALLASSEAQARRAHLTSLDIKDNLLLLIEKNWNDVNNAQVRYQALQSNIDLSKKVLELRKLGMQEGVNTIIEVVQAQTQYLKARTEQAQAANDYVQALAKLMQSCGTPLAFNDYLNDADILLPQLYQEAENNE